MERHGALRGAHRSLTEPERHISVFVFSFLIKQKETPMDSEVKNDRPFLSHFVPLHVRVRWTVYPGGRIK